MPVWARNGRELFYARGHEADTRELVAHDVDPAGTISRSGRRLFSLAAIRAEAYSPVPGYDVTPDGKRFVFVQSVEDPPAPPHPSQIHIVLNWFQELRAKVLSGK